MTRTQLHARTHHGRSSRGGWTRIAVLALVLGLAALVVPDSAVKPTEVSLVRIRHGSGLDAQREMVWILAVGSDARPGEDMNRTRGDALQLVGINTRTHAATAIGIPRDSWVSIPGYGSERINAALYFGGPRLLGQTVGNLVGVQPDYVMVTRFPFFEDMVDSIGGIEVQNPRPFSDSNLYATGFKQGRIHLNGYGAMAFSRIRKTLPGGDFDRSANQQRTLRGIQAKIRARAAEARLHGAWRDVGARAHLHQRLARRALRAGPGRCPGRARQDHQLRRPGQHRLGRRRQRRLPARRLRPPLRRRRAQRRHDQALLSGRGSGKFPRPGGETCTW